MKTWRIHLSCLLLAAALLVLHAVRHRDSAELEAALARGDARARIAALHTLCNRPESETGDMLERTRALLADPDPLLREFAATSAMARFGRQEALPPELQENYLQAMLDEARGGGPLGAHAWLFFAFYRRKVGDIRVGSRGRLDRDEVDWVLKAMRGVDPPRSEALKHVVERG